MPGESAGVAAAIANGTTGLAIDAQTSLLGTLKGKRFALLGFDPEETQALRAAINFASAQVYVIGLPQDNPRLNSLAPFDICVVNLASTLSRAEAAAVARKPAVMIGDPDEVSRYAFVLASTKHEFIIRPWTREEFFLRTFLALRSAGGEVIEFPDRAPAVREPTLIVADDDRTTAVMVQSILRGMKTTCVVARDGREALALTQKLKPEALLLDVGMPGLDGFHVLAALRDDPATRTMPIMMLTASHSEKDMVRGFELGADDYVTKPFRPYELIARLKRLMRAQSQSPA